MVKVMRVVIVVEVTGVVDEVVMVMVVIISILTGTGLQRQLAEAFPAPLFRRLGLLLRRFPCFVYQLLIGSDTFLRLRQCPLLCLGHLRFAGQSTLLGGDRVQVLHHLLAAVQRGHLLRTVKLIIEGPEIHSKGDEKGGRLQVAIRRGPVKGGVPKQVTPTGVTSERRKSRKGFENGSK